jgi:hypothetical protein
LELEPGTAFRSRPEHTTRNRRASPCTAATVFVYSDEPATSFRYLKQREFAHPRFASVQ